MFSFIIISNLDSISNEVLSAISEIGKIRKEAGGRLIVESSEGMKNGWLAFQSIKDAQCDYESDELEKIKQIINNPSFYLIEGRNGAVNFSNTFIQKLSTPDRVLIDNDHGMIADLIKVKEKIKLGEDWLHSSSS
ncbi:MAG: hypothetical protein HYY98_10190 [Burkholderiales bacterium]|nr:hypothetical protein [Burkholderiales bacterium]MBI3153128.1 hypothetical protein [Chloroflexota bacterium]